MRETREVSSVAGSLSDHGEGASKDYNSYVTPQGAMAESKNGGQPSSDEKVPALIETLGSSLSDEAKAYREEVVWRTKSKLVGFLVSYSSDPSGRYIELREGRLLITRDVTSNDSYLVINDANVSPLHATMRISADGAILVLDQLSEHGTHVLPSDGSEQRTLNGDKGDLFHGDVVVFGKCEYHVVTVGVIPSKQAKA
jgi:hypothetical protein